MKNRNWKQEIKDWWNENKSSITSGFAIGVLGAFAGYAAGMSATDRMWLEHTMLKSNRDTSDNESDYGFVMDGSNCDDPELLEMIRLVNEENS